MTTYPFKDLEVGEAFTAPAGMTTAANMAQLCNHHGKRMGRRFSYACNVDGSITVSRREGAIGQPSLAIHAAPPAGRTRAQIMADYQRQVDALSLR